MKRGILLLLLSLFMFCAFAQDAIQPQFPGGNALLLQYLSSAPLPVSPYPFEEEKVIKVPAWIDPFGMLRVVVLKEITDPYEIAAFNHVSRMPAWTAGVVNGRTIESDMVIKVVFNKNNPGDIAAYCKRMNDIFYNAGVSELQSKHYQAASDLFTQAISYNTKDADSYYNRGISELYDQDTLSACGSWYQLSLAGSSNGTSLIDKYCGKYKYLETDVTLDDSIRFQKVEEVMALFPGGDLQLEHYLATSVVYPQMAKEEDIEGVTYVSFVVDKEGNIVNVNVARSSHPYLDKEAIRVISAMPKWKPGTQNGKPVQVKYTVPVRFKLN